MKKIIVTILALSSIAPIAAEQFFDIEWADFCPSKYANIKTDTFHYTAEGRYWADRKKAFDKRLEKCNSYTGSSKEACYEKLREIEYSATQLHGDGGSQRKLLKYMIMNNMRY